METAERVTDLAGLLLEKHADIMRRFVDDVRRKELSPPDTRRSLLVDGLPAFLEEVARELTLHRDLRVTSEALDESPSAREHGAQRWTLGYNLSDLIREYGVLRHAIVHLASENGITPSLGELEILAKCLNVAIAEAATAYAAFRDEEQERQREQLAFLSESGQLLSSSLDYQSTLSRLTALVVPRLADWCAVHLEGTSVDERPISHRDPDKVWMLREIYREFGPADLPSQTVVARGESVLMESIEPALVQRSAKSEKQRKLLEIIDSRSYLLVPLSIQGRTFGALTMVYSSSGRRYSRADLPLAQDLARRAAIAIDNARLYELSQQERARMEGATRAKNEFVAMLSHELRTPLNAMLGWVRLLRGDALPEDKRKHALEVVERNALAQSQMVDDLLDIGRVMTGQLRLQPTQVDFHGVVELAVESVRSASEAKNITIDGALGEGALMLRGDSERLQQVVWTLLANAVKFTPKGGLVKVRVRQLGSDVQLTVEDDGIGIEPAFLPHVFDSFRQFDGSAARAHGGLGIGLSIAKHLVELHGGSIEAHSKGLQHGARFVVNLPVSSTVSKPLSPNKVAATKVETTMKEPSQGLEGLRVLVVDDEPDARELVGYVLSRSGVEVELASSVPEALQLLATFDADLIVSDIGMPGEDGYSFIRSVRSLPSEKSKLPAIALTAFTANHDRTRALVAGFNMHLSKPIEPAALVQAVAQLTDRS